MLLFQRGGGWEETKNSHRSQDILQQLLLPLVLTGVSFVVLFDCFIYMAGSTATHFCYCLFSVVDFLGSDSPEAATPHPQLVTRGAVALNTYTYWRDIYRAAIKCHGVSPF